MSKNSKPRRLGKNEVILREHSYDGIQEFDQRLPNWWLWTFYGAIIFSFFYWFLLFQADDGSLQKRMLDQKIDSIKAEKMAALDSFDNSTLWEMSQNQTIVAKGEATYAQVCQSCHLQSLRGKDEPGGIGENLVDDSWKYGGQPSDVMEIVLNGSPDKTAGMQAWESALGTQKVAEVVAYVMSYHSPN